MAGAAGCGLDRFAGICRPMGDVDACEFDRQIEGACRLGHESGVGGRCPAAQAVVEMADDEIAEPVVEQQVEQCH